MRRLQNISKTSKRNSKFHLKLQKLEAKKQEHFLEFFVNRALFHCKGGLSLTEPR